MSKSGYARIEIVKILQKTHLSSFGMVYKSE